MSDKIDVRIDRLAFKTQVDRGYQAKTFYLIEPQGDALVEIYHDGKLLRLFLFPAYKIWNIAAHFKDIVDSEIAGDRGGYDMAAWTGFDILPTI
jgi:hypothetical protein